MATLRAVSSLHLISSWAVTHQWGWSPGHSGEVLRPPLPVVLEDGRPRASADLPPCVAGYRIPAFCPVLLYWRGTEAERGWFTANPEAGETPRVEVCHSLSQHASAPRMDRQSLWEASGTWPQ